MLLYLPFLLSLTHVSRGLTRQCLNEKGEPVDWFYVYKVPRIESHKNPLVQQGAAHVYLTPEHRHMGWVLSNFSIGDINSLVGRTLSSLYQDDKNISVIYNDQPPPTQCDCLSHKTTRNIIGVVKKREINPQRCKCDKPSSSRKAAPIGENGHTKGVVLGDKYTSLWLVHSVPHFPPVPNSRLNVSYSYPETGKKFGQTFLCISLKTASLDQVGNQLKYNEPLIVHGNVPKDLEATLPNLVDVLRNITVRTSPWSHITGFDTLGGRKFLSFAKSGMYHDDLYSGLVADTLQSDLLVETWTNGPGPLDSECKKKFQVRNIQSLKFPEVDVNFNSHHDHSKWAVAVAPRMRHRSDVRYTQHWVCVGDINRALSQESRGGGTVCTADPLIWSSFSSRVNSAQKCDTTAADTASPDSGMPLIPALARCIGIRFSGQMAVENGKSPVNPMHICLKNMLGRQEPTVVTTKN